MDAVTAVSSALITCDGWTELKKTQGGGLKTISNVRGWVPPGVQANMRRYLQLHAVILKGTALANRLHNQINESTRSVYNGFVSHTRKNGGTLRKCLQENREHEPRTLAWQRRQRLLPETMGPQRQRQWHPATPPKPHPNKTLY